MQWRQRIRPILCILPFIPESLVLCNKNNYSKKQVIGNIVCLESIQRRNFRSKQKLNRQILRPVLFLPKYWEKIKERTLPFDFCMISKIHYRPKTEFLEKVCSVYTWRVWHFVCRITFWNCDRCKDDVYHE